MPTFRNRTNTVRVLSASAALALAAAACGGDDQAAAGADGEEIVEVEMAMFSPPSLGAFLPAVIDDQEFDLAHGIDIVYQERAPDAYNQEFAAGHYQVGASGSLMSEAQRVSQGVDVAYLFNVHDFWATVVATDDSVTELADLNGRDLAAVASSTSYAMFQWFAQEAGLDLSTVDITNTQTGGLGTQALTGRSTAVQMWEPGYSTLMASNDTEGLTELDIQVENWEARYGFSAIPYLGVAAHRSWIEENQELIPRLQAIYEDAAEWALANPEEAGEIIAATIPDGEAEPIIELLRDNDRLGLNVYGAGEQADAIRAVFEAGVEIGYFDDVPSDDAIYFGDDA